MKRRFLAGALVLGAAFGAAWLVGSAEVDPRPSVVLAEVAAPHQATTAAAPATPQAEVTRHTERTSDTVVASNPTPEPALPQGAEPVVGGVCPSDMVLVEGDYCTEVRHTCREWLDDPKLQYARCGVYEPTAKCVGKRVTMRYCIDRYEYTAPGDQKPLNHQSFVSGSKICKAQGKRLCVEPEWNFACEGEEMRPYPYGWERKAVCNQDRDDLFEMAKGKQVLKDHREPSGERLECVSPFGVYNMAGNVDEPTLREGATHNYPFRTALKGGWWMAARNRCRPATTAHDDHYEDIQVGVRCCADAPGTESGPNG